MCTSKILSPVFSVPLRPAGPSSRMCLIKMPLITSPLLRRLPMPRPPTILMPRDFPASLCNSTLSKHTKIIQLTSNAKYYDQYIIMTFPQLSSLISFSSSWSHLLTQQHQTLQALNIFAMWDLIQNIVIISQEL